MKIILYLVVVCLLSSCTTTVKLTAKNSTNIPVDVSAELADKNGTKDGELNLFSLDKDETKTASFDVDKKGSFTLFAGPTGASPIFKKIIPVKGQSNPYLVSQTITRIGNLLDDRQSLKTISDSFKNLGDNIGGSPRDLQSALQTVIGAMVVAIPESDGKPGKIIHTITPIELGVKVVQLEEVPKYDNQEMESVVITGSAAMDAKTSIGPYGAFGASLKRDSAYTLAWTLKGFGQVDKIESADRQPLIQLGKLSPEVRRNLYGLLKDNPTAKLYYINHYYVLRQALLKIKEHKRSDASTSLDASNIVTASGVFTQEFATEQEKSYSDVILNFYGQPLASNFPLTDDAEDNLNKVRLKPTGEKQEMIPPEAIEKLSSPPNLP